MLGRWDSRLRLGLLDRARSARSEALNLLTGLEQVGCGTSEPAKRRSLRPVWSEFAPRATPGPRSCP